MRQNRYKLTLARSYFWRTTQQQEVDYIEEKGQKLSGFAFKWQPRKASKLAKTFTERYQATGAVITRENFRDFVCLGKDV